MSEQAVLMTAGASGPTVLWRDTFTDPDGTLIFNHTPEVGSGYHNNRRASQAAISTVPPVNDIRSNQLAYRRTGGPVFNVGAVATKISFKWNSSGSLAQAYFVRVDPADNLFGARLVLTNNLGYLYNAAGTLMATTSVLNNSLGLTMTDDGTNNADYLKVYDHNGVLRITSNVAGTRNDKTWHAVGQVVSGNWFDNLLIESF